MRLAILSLFISVLAVPSPAADTHLFSIQDMLAMDRISDWQVSPDGTRVVFTVSVTDLKANRRRSDIFVAKIDGSGVRQLTTDPANDGQPRWNPDGKSLYFISNRSGSPQVWRCRSTAGRPNRLQSFPLGVRR